MEQRPYKPNSSVVAQRFQVTSEVEISEDNDPEEDAPEVEVDTSENLSDEDISTSTAE